MTEKSRKIKATPNRWFRFYAESLDDPKVQRLPAHLFKTWVNLLSMACTTGGTISREDVAFRLRLSEHDASTQIDELIGLGLLDITTGMKLEPHNWRNRQFASDTSTDRVRKHRETKAKIERNVSCNEIASPPEQNRAESETDSPIPPQGDFGDVPSNVKPIQSWATAFAQPDEHSGVIRTEGGNIKLLNGTRQLWLDKFGNDASRLDAALLEISGAINDGSRKPLAADVQGRLGRILGQKIDSDRRYQSAVAANAAERAKAKAADVLPFKVTVAMHPNARPRDELPDVANA